MATGQRQSRIAALLTVIACTSVFSTNYYVDANNNQAGDTKPGSQTEPWLTIAKANQTLVAGDTVFIKAGTYGTYIAPKNSGASLKPIVYKNFGTDSVTVSAAMFGIDLNGKSYIIVQGINFSTVDRFLYVRNGSNRNTIAFCNFDGAKLTNGQTATWAGSVIQGGSQHNRVHHCRFSNYGYYNADDKGCVIDIGAESNKADSTRYNLIEGSYFFHGGHHVMGVYGKYNVIRRNHFHNEPWAMGTAQSDKGAILYGNRNLSFSGYSENGGFNLFEYNRVGYSSDPSDNNGASGMATNSSENIVRFNAYFHNISAGLSMSVTSSYLQNILRNKVYNNTFYDNGHNPDNPKDHMSSGIGFGIYSGPLIIQDNVFKNNLLYKHRIPLGEYNINTPDRTGIIKVQSFAKNWNGDSLGDPRFVNPGPVPGNPMDTRLPDLRLQAASLCINAGAYLTTITSASGSGTTFQVADAGYFTDGWGIGGVQGDLLQLLGTTQRARISAIDYAIKTITVDKTVTWSQNQGICLAYEGSAPDIGAHEYDAGNIVVYSTPPKFAVRNTSFYTLYNVRGQKVGVLTEKELYLGKTVRAGGVYISVAAGPDEKQGKKAVRRFMDRIE